MFGLNSTGSWSPRRPSSGRKRPLKWVKRTTLATVCLSTLKRRGKAGAFGKKTLPRKGRIRDTSKKQNDVVTLRCGKMGEQSVGQQVGRHVGRLPFTSLGHKEVRDRTRSRSLPLGSRGDIPEGGARGGPPCSRPAGRDGNAIPSGRAPAEALGLDFWPGPQSSRPFLVWAPDSPRTLPPPRPL